MSASDESRKAREAIAALRRMAQDGDREAIMHLHSLGSGIALHLCFLGMYPSKAAQAVAESAAQADEWPVSIPAIQELRKDAVERQLPPSLGSRLTIRPTPTPGSGGTRYFDPNTKGGFAHQIWKFFDAAYGLNHFPTSPAQFSDSMTTSFLSCTYMDGWRPVDFSGWLSESQKRMRPVTEKAKALPLLTVESLPQWKALGTEWAEAICLGRWEDYPWPQKIIDRAATPSSKFAMSPRGCKVVVKEWIAGGFEAMIAPD